MRILQQSPRTGEIKLQLESQDDIWHVYNIICRGDLVIAATYRRADAKMGKDKLRPEKAEKRKMTLGIRVDETEYHEFSDRLRVAGKIEEGPQDLGQHHTLNLEPGEIITIRRETWPPHTMQRLKDSVAAAKRPLITFLSIDDDEAVFAVLRQSGVQQISNIVSNVPGKGYESGQAARKREYYDAVLKELGRIYAEGALIILGPGFSKEEFAAYAREKSAEALKSFELRATGQSGMTGIHEMLKSGLDMKILDGQRAVYELQVVERLLAEIARDGKCAYGPDEVARAVDSGAVDTLVVLDRLVRSQKIESLMKRAEDARGTVVVVSSNHEGGKRLDGIGGIAAILRYRIAQ